MFNALEVLQPNFIQRPLNELWQLISPLYTVNEEQWLQQLLPLAEPTDAQLKTCTDAATNLIEQVRKDDESISMIDALLLEYSLDTKEGILLMCLAEALMRVPDKETADAFIKDRLSVADWASHAKNSDSFFVNASTWGLMLTGKVVTMSEKEDGSPANLVNRMVNRVSEPVIRKAMNQAMKIMGHQFVLGRSISEALTRGKSYRDDGYTYSFDMLGEAALTADDAKKYLKSYEDAVESVGKDSYNKGHRPTISIKLSALHPRYEVGSEERVMTELFESVKGLIKKARALDVGITIDAEEADRLELSLHLFEKLYRDDVAKGWGLFGLVIQAYSKRALPVLGWLAALSKEQGDRIPLRLVKGAYWDSEIKLCQQKGLSGYPVYTRKEATDVSYLACAHFLLSEHTRQHIFPQFASHNAHTIAAISCLAEQLGARTDEFEFQRLHGMGDALYNRLIKDRDVCVRIYAPVGSHKDLLPYLVRRLLENGANSSFVHRLVDATYPVSDLVDHPVTTLKGRKTLHNPYIKLPIDMFEDRKNSYGPNIEIESEWGPFKAEIDAFMEQSTQWRAFPIVGGVNVETNDTHAIDSPYDHNQNTGRMDWANKDVVTSAIDKAEAAFPEWNAKPASERAICLDKMADLMEENYPELMAICHREAGKTIQDSIDEVREAVDFCRYYAQEARNHFENPTTFKNYLGESKEAQLKGRGVFACISPWNFPLAIFTGQVVAALVSGNTVICKPAEQTSLIAYRAVQMLHKAGVPGDVLHLVPGDGMTVGAPLTCDKRIAGVAFTGSTGTAQMINRTLAARGVAPVPVIAETGGQNAMLIDSTSLPEQVVRDAVRSAFASAGQRCSALRVMFVQADIADRVIPMIKGAMKEQSVGLPYLHSTDVGPVIDKKAQNMLLEHIEHMKSAGKLIAQSDLPDFADKGTFVAPTAFEIKSIDQLTDEKFGPILHVVRYKAKDLDSIIDTINNSGFGLTMGVHSRNETTCARIAQRARVGNLYINRDQVGAVVGVQPFGGQGLSGTGPKAGGPHYLQRFAIEQYV
ncbi:bifunctional proline dehydrogenase/L-glutamate gamma-semialdehyde dehydrogenase PutA [Marinomonas mediterranea]|jgi:L-proline dehydrogenase (EC 1.5.99.8)/delta-1-pyrroline-5-carboxylate dehydrogenase (EC 1.5.1.12)|uniref:Bifunctional protein PutA n=1 Tax=Marinomonas mediterranea (strain ATCC 700492 / JCM 21426 / NBRC 103028 / MMB-1) TaxID=717774 RepID=F2K118_MARM1|nr:bifunctional proline dehydrogenase/L-glutamate gamma-semialdehyde dehydrogenase PutA [Marinomonas mediterranea]ADZ93367.1 delta-1-pyrroline-5-carboxylate dehydrogenase [Marinomonas mediterranea MMB-1]WCN11255.1 bifunctional proline dehydrogenase/L-glutamate gamma-semialdehyde dehydrogenase PutA [Marinomonas mediterranea]WCN15319.1 bifunctional proline dehydrogenase/L-glutamate gamma-semialdehyde dehydrogenase PutA [Marinomonas mediterranea]WCN19363.1 bifunctional proline dehydrogenase/L-glut